MKTYQRFEDLPVWQTTARLYDRCADFLDRVTHVHPSFRDQLERAVLSVSNNIAEGFERGTTNELLAFLYIARGSAGEVRSMLTLLARRPGLTNFQSDLKNLSSQAESCSRQLRAWADTLQNSEIAGPRHLNEEHRERWRKRKAAAEGEKAFDEMQHELISTLPPDHPLRRQWERKHAP